MLIFILNPGKVFGSHFVYIFSFSFFMEHPCFFMWFYTQFRCQKMTTPRPLFSNERIQGIQIFGKNLVMTYLLKKNFYVYRYNDGDITTKSRTSVMYNLSLLVRIVDIFFHIFFSALLRQRKFYEFRYTLYAIIYFNRENFFIDKVYVLKSIGKCIFVMYSKLFLSLLYLFE